MYRFVLMMMAALLTAVIITPARADLDTYLSRKEPAYRWELKTTSQHEGVTIYDVHLTSQTWQGITWEHRLQIFAPDNADHPHFCALLNTGGNGGTEEEVLGTLAARATGCMFAILYNIPNQPLYDGRTEDALVVYTWLKFLETGDESWPLHFPMAKAVIKAMDAIQELTRQQKRPSVDGFLITGASKRGWTTWLAGASRDRRIKAIAPMVIDTLNVAAQTPHQLAAYGKLSEQVDDYTSAGIMTKMQTPQGKRLLQLEDPYSYLDRLTLPKLIILGTNDRYWAQDALNLYWDDLKGPKWVLYDPNSGHGLEDRVRVFNTLTAFIRSIAARKPWPKMRWTYQESGNGVNLTVKSEPPAVAASLFRAFAPTQDFRNSRWTSDPMALTNGDWTGSLDTPTTGCAVVFGELTYEIDGKKFTLSTQVRILGKATQAASGGK